MNPGFLEFLKAAPEDRRDVFLGAACRDYIHDTLFPQLSILVRAVLSAAGIDSHLGSMVVDDHDPDGQT